MNRILDQIDDLYLDMLPKMLMKLLPDDILEHSIDPIEDILPQLFTKNIKLQLSTPPLIKIKVIDTPNGRMIIGGMKQQHIRIMSNKIPFEEAPIKMLPTLIRNSIPPEEFAYDNKFPISDPFQAFLSLIYAMAQRDIIGNDFDKKIVPQIEHKLGKNTVKDILNTKVEEKLRNKIKVKIDDYLKTLEEAKELEKKDKDVDVKKASSNYVFKNTRKEKYNALLKKSGLVQTSLLKLAKILSVYKEFPEMINFINLLKNSMITDGLITIASNQLQLELAKKLASIFKNMGEEYDENDQYIRDLIYNTSLTKDSGEIINIVVKHPNGKEEYYPVDVEKLNNLTYQEAVKALTSAIADEIFDSNKEKVNIEKFKKFMNDIQKTPDTQEEFEEIFDRILSPILITFSPDKEIEEEIGLSDEKIEKVEKINENKNKKDPEKFEQYRSSIFKKFGIDIKDFKDTLKGGLADIDEITSFNLEQLLKGIEVEKEHTSNLLTALEIAMDHLKELPDYYTRLEKIENGN